MPLIRLELVTTCTGVKNNGELSGRFRKPPGPMQEQQEFLTLAPPLQLCYLYSMAIKIKSKDTLGQIGHTSSPEGFPATLSRSSRLFELDLECPLKALVLRDWSHNGATVRWWKISKAEPRRGLLLEAALEEEMRPQPYTFSVSFPSWETILFCHALPAGMCNLIPVHNITGQPIIDSKL